MFCQYDAVLKMQPQVNITPTVPIEPISEDLELCAFGDAGGQPQQHEQWVINQVLLWEIEVDIERFADF